MVYVDSKELGWEPYFLRWMNNKVSPKEDQGGENENNMVKDNFEEIYKRYIPKIIDFIYEGKDDEQMVPAC